MKTRSIAQKFGIWLVLVTFFVMILFGIINYFLFVNQLDKDLNVRLDESTSRVSDTLALHVWNLDNQRVQEVAQNQAFLESFAQLHVRDSFGDTIHEAENLTEDGEFVYIERDIIHEGNVAGSIRAAFSTENIEVAKNAVIRSTLVIIFVVILTVLVLAFFIARSISRPIVSLTRTAKEVASGDLSKRAVVTTQDEVGILAETFNSMIIKIEALDKSKSEFISIASHQLRTPITSIQWFTELLASKPKDLNAEQKEFVDLMSQSAKRMSHLIDQLLNVATLEGGDSDVAHSEFSLRNFITKSIKDIKALGIEHKKHTITLKTKTDNLHHITTDKELLYQVLENLILNAVSYSGHPYKIDIEIQQEIDIYKILVTDYGMGIPKEDQEKVFQKFYRSEKAVKIKTEGSGLGLYSVKVIMKILGGDISFESIENERTTFTMTLPKKFVS